MEHKTSIIRTAKMWCGMCKRKLNPGEIAVFYFNKGRFVDVYCHVCGNSDIDYEFDLHPYADVQI